MDTRRILFSSLVALASVSTPVFAAQQTQVVQVAKPASNTNTATSSNANAGSAAEIASNRFTSVPEPSDTAGLLNNKLGLNNPNSRFKINGFFSTGASRSTSGVEYNFPEYGSVKNAWNFAANTLIGLQFAFKLNHALSVVTQLVADGDDTNGNKPYQVQADWAYLRYTIGNHYQFRAGRFRLPAFLYSQTQQVGYSYPWVFLPNEVYRIVPFQNVNGVDFTYRYPFGNSGWNVSFEPYFGQNSSQFDLYTGGVVAVPQGATANFQENSIVGAVARIGNPYFTLRATWANLKLTGVIPGDQLGLPFGLTMFQNANTSYYAFGARLNYANWLAVGEFAHRQTPSDIAALTGYYGSLGYHFGQFLPIFTYAHIDTTNTADLLTEQRLSVAELPIAQDSYTLGLDWYVSSNFLAKLGVSDIVPLKNTNGLFSAKPAQTHVYLYSISLNAIF